MDGTRKRREYICTIGSHCHVCKAEFYPTALWAYKRDKWFFCSWRCLREYERRKEAESAKRAAERKRKKNAARARDQDGDNALKRTARRYAMP